MNELEELAQTAESNYDLSDFAATVRACRSYRRFDEGDPIDEALLVELVNLARVVASGASRLPLRYRIVHRAAEREAVFAQLKWAGALRDWDGPEPGERPTGYIVICDAGGGATTSVDEGIAAQTILLAATQAGYGGCMLHAFNKVEVARALGLDGEGRSVRGAANVSVGGHIGNAASDGADESATADKGDAAGDAATSGVGKGDDAVTNGADAAANISASVSVKPLMVIALGRPAEEVRLEPLSASPDGSTSYWRDAADVHHVPKRSLEDVLL